MIDIINKIKSDINYQSDSIAYTANLVCYLLNEETIKNNLDITEEVIAVVSFGELLLYSCLSNLHFDDPKDISKIYNIIHEKYEQSECRLRQSMES